MFVVFLIAHSVDVLPFSDLFQTGKVRFEQEFVLDDERMPEGVFFETPSTVSCDPEGNIYVVDSGAKNIKKFDAQGKFLKTIGREGQGPGEFDGPYYSTFAGDRLIVWDSGSRRLSYFTPEGDFVNSINIAYNEGWVRGLRGLPSGEVVVEMERSYRREPDKPQECRIDLYSAELKFIRTIYNRELWRKKYIRTKEYGTSTLYFPYSADVRWDVLPDGRIVIGYSENYELEIFDQSGNKISSISHKNDPVDVTEKDKKDYFDSIEFYRMGERLKDPPEYVTKYTEFPKHKPVYKNILADSEGNIWVVLNRKNQDEDGKIFDVFDRTGKFVSRVSIDGDTAFPDSRNAYVVNTGAFLLIETDENDLYRLTRFKISGG
jgi:DNA-binding beta-propeller fold protein YncE